MRIVSHSQHYHHRKPARACAPARYATMRWRTAIFLLSMMLTGIVGSQQNLPEMGEPSDSVLSPAQERALGRSFMRQIRARLPLVSDSQINEYVQNLGTRLGSSATNRNGVDYRFFILADNSINAFAIPGGYIGVNAGLIDAMTREEQLAGVLAHEVAHLTQRHHARAFETAGKNRMSTAAAIIAAILIGASNPQAGQAALAAGLAISQQNAINYTRSHEYEADRIGIQILASAEYDPAAIAEAFEIMRRKNSINSSGAQIEYLRTHPLDSNRIAEARSRAAQMARSKQLALSGGTQNLGPASLDNAVPARNQFDFRIVQARLKILSSRDDARLFREYQASYQRNKTPAVGYALALLAIKGKNFKKADSLVQALSANDRENYHLQLMRATIAQGMKDFQQSAAILEELISTYPSRYSSVEQYSEQLLSQGKLQKAQRVIREYQRDNTDPDPRSWRVLANIQERLGDKSGSHESLAAYFFQYGALKRSQQQIQMALRVVKAGSKDELRLRAQLKQIEQQLK